MTWYLIALVMFTGSDDAHLKINTALKFRSFESCQEYYNTYSEGLQDGLQRAFPNITNISIQCVDQKMALEMQKHQLERDSK